MSRPSKNTDKLLIEAAKTLIPRYGVRGLKIRDVAKKAGVNLGMFNYHFKTKEAFLEILMSETYGEMLKGLEVSAHSGNNSLENLKGALVELGVFVRDHRDIIMPLIEEILAGNRRIMEFARTNMSKHIFILLGLIRMCQKDGFIRKDVTPFLIMVNILLPTVVPNIMVRAVEKHYSMTLLNLFTRPFKNMLLSDKSFAQRVEMALKGVSAG